MEVDTEAMYSVMDEAEFSRRFPAVLLEGSNIQLRGHFGHQSVVTVLTESRERWAMMSLSKRVLTPSLEYTGQELLVCCYIVSLMYIASMKLQTGEASFLNCFWMDWVHCSVLSRPRQDCTRMRSCDFFQPRTVPFALQDLEHQEIQRLHHEGILNSVRTSKWAAPWVPVMNKDGKLRLCGGFKLTVNRVADVEIQRVWMKFGQNWLAVFCS